MASEANEPLDRNKSPLTHVATATTAMWLDGIGCKPIESEVPMPNGTIADLAALWEPTHTEAKRSRLFKDVCTDAICRECTDNMTYVYRQLGGTLTISVEVKVSRADFQKDFGRKYADAGNQPTLRTPTHFLIVAAPASVVEKKTMLSCGVLTLSECGTRVVKWRGPWMPSPVFPGEIENVIRNIAIRRDHVTRYAASRRMMKSWRARDIGERVRADTKRSERLQQILDRLCATGHESAVSEASRWVYETRNGTRKLKESSP